MPDVTRLAITPIDTPAFDDWRNILNIEIRDTAAECIWWQDSCHDLYKEIGVIGYSVTDGIHIYPYRDTTPHDLEVLHGAAIEAASKKPSTKTGWARHIRNGKRSWVCTISTSIVDEHIQLAIRAGEGRQERNRHHVMNASVNPTQP